MVSAGTVWRRFGHEFRALLDNDKSLSSLLSASLAGDAVAFTVLYATIFDLVSAWVLALGDSVGHWYDDEELAKRYSSTQVAVVPLRAEWTMRMADEASALLAQRPDTSALDVGTGDGVMALAIAKQVGGYRIFASDRSEAMIAAHRARFETAGIHAFGGHDLSGEGEWSSALCWRRRMDRTEFTGFQVITAYMCLHIIPNREQLYRKLFYLLAPSGSLFVVHDFLRPDGAARDFAPMATIIEGYDRYLATNPAKPVGLAGYIAGFILRRFFLQGDKLLPLAQELTSIQSAGFHVTCDIHPHYTEFAFIKATRPL